jgi:PP-loop superfamily ATP-utilizing enzyme
MSIQLKETVINIVKELEKHAEKDECYSCKQLLKTGFVQRVKESQK